MNKKKSKSKFANIIVIFCLAMSTIITACTIYEYHRLDVVISSNVLSVLMMLYGGELLILCVRTIIGSDVTKAQKNAVSDGDRI